MMEKTMKTPPQSLLRWSEKYSIGIEMIDSQHKKLLGMINELYEHLTKSGYCHDASFRVAVKGAVEYVKYHFSAEQELMKEINYPLLEEQQRMHSEFIAELLAEVKRYENGDSLAPNRFVRFLEVWFLNHISIEDMKIGFFMQKNK